MKVDLRVTRDKKRIAALSAAVASFLVICFLYLASSPLPASSPGVLVEVRPGDSTGAVAHSLKRAGLIRNEVFFRAVARAIGADGRIQAGEYMFSSGSYVWEILRQMVEGRVVVYPITIPEGTRLTQIAAILEERGFADSRKFLKIASDPGFIPGLATPEELANTMYPLEGYLFPDTYYLRKGLTEEDIIRMMLSRFNQVFNEELKAKARSMGLSVHQVATLASIVEKEAASAEERPIIAAVYLNRLRIGMNLEACPTVLYATGKIDGSPVLFKDLEVDSLYNTYKNPGLPPGPICSFGKASLEAVLNPASVDYLYFVSKNDGTHAFARTFEEHLQNVMTFQGR